MKTPPGLLGLAIVFWGWQTGLLMLAVPMAVMLEGARLIPWRWDLTPVDEGRISDLSTLVFVGLAIYLAFVVGAAMRVFQWMPLALAPLMAAQAVSRAGTIAISAMLWARREQRMRGWPQRRVDLSWIYVALCLAAASAANVRTVAFYAGLVALGGWALWSARPRAFPARVWVGAFALASLLGYAGHVGLHALQKVVERITLGLVSDVRDLDVDPSASHTAIGRIGALKLTGRVVLRVEPDDGVAIPVLLRDASYDTYRGGVWLAVGADFSPVARSASDDAWVLASDCERARRVGVAAPLASGKGLLPLPLGTCRVDAGPVEALRRNRLGAVRVDGGPRLVSYAASFVRLPGGDPAGAGDAPPTDADLRLPKAEGPIVTRFAAELGLGGRAPADVVQNVEAFFRDRFRYSTFQDAAAADTTPLGHFLARSRAGHCEYFATATVLLLRAAGVPARYATGYSVQEWSRLERRWIVRARHAHAWAVAWVDGGWRQVDTTPPVWAVEERRLTSAWEPAGDVWAWVSFVVRRWWTGEGGSWTIRTIPWLAVPLAAWLAWRFLPRRWVERIRRRASDGIAITPPAGADSEFYAVERALAARGLGRRSEEPVTRWLARIERSAPSASALSALGALHCRYRLDPAGLGAADREALRQGARVWLEANP